MRLALLCADAGIPLGGTKGSSVHLRAVAGAWLRMGHEVVALVANAGPEAGRAPLEAQGLRVHVLADPRSRSAIRAALAEVAPDLVHERLALLAPEGACAARELGVPHVYEVNAPLDEEAAAHRGFDRLEDARAAFRTGFAASRGAMAVSEEVAHWVRGLAPQGFPVIVEANGAGQEFLATPDPSELRAFKAARGLPEDVFVIGFVGTFRPWHDLDTVLEAARTVGEHVPTRLLMVGDGPQREHIVRTMAEGPASLTLTGAVPHDDVPRYLACCDAVAVPYATRDVYFSPLKLIEAMAAGRAVVASATGPVARVVRDGHDGLLVEPGDRAAFAAALLRCARDPMMRARLGDEARRTVTRTYTWDAVTARVLSFALGLTARTEDAWRA